MSVLSIAKANLILTHYAITEPDDINLEAIAYGRGLLIEERETRNCEGRLINNGKNGIIVVNSNIIEPGKKRFVIAHEIGHFELKKTPEKLNICDEHAFMNWHKNGEDENDANEFAAELLMPRYMYKSNCLEGRFNKEHIIHLAKIFNTSLASTALRYTQIGPVPIAVVYSQNGLVKWSACSKAFPYQFIQSKVKVRPESYAHDFFTGKMIPESPAEILADAWFLSDRNFKANHTLIEQSIIYSTYNSVLTFVWEKF